MNGMKLEMTILAAFALATGIDAFRPQFGVGSPFLGASFGVGFGGVSFGAGLGGFGVGLRMGGALPEGNPNYTSRPGYGANRYPDLGYPPYPYTV